MAALLNARVGSGTEILVGRRLVRPIPGLLPCPLCGLDGCLAGRASVCPSRKWTQCCPWAHEWQRLSEAGTR